MHIDVPRFHEVCDRRTSGSVGAYTQHEGDDVVWEVEDQCSLVLGHCAHNCFFLHTLGHFALKKE